MTFEEFITSCYSIPYSKTATTQNKFGEPMNCYGLVYWYYKLIKGVQLESVGVSSFDNIHSVTYNKVDIPSDGDVVDIRTDENCHVGIVVNDIVYHFTQNGLLSKNRFRMINFIKGFYHVHATENT